MLKFVDVLSILLLACIIAGCNRDPYVPLPPPPAPSSLDAMTSIDIHSSFKPASASCNIEMIDGRLFSGHPIKLENENVMTIGWLVPEISHKEAESAELRFINNAEDIGWRVGIHHWVPNDGVLKAMGARETFNDGFAQYIDTKHLASGSYHLSLLFRSEGVDYLCDKGSTVIVP